MLNWNIEKKHLILKYNWKISRNESDAKTNFFVKTNDGIFSGMGEAAPNIRYGETPEVIQKQFQAFLSSSPFDITTVDELQNILNSIPLTGSLRFAVESAFVHFLCQRNRQKVHEYFHLPYHGNTATSFTLPIMDIGQIRNFWKERRLSRFMHLKIKINSEEGMEIIKEVSKTTSQPLMIDANEAWKDVEECIYFVEKIKKCNILFLEQPMPSSFTEEYIHLKKYSPFALTADESITDFPDWSLLKKQFHGINMKLMKAGGYLNGIKILKTARQLGFQTMTGCMVETTLGISSAMNLCALSDFADIDGFLLIENEPFGLVKETDGRIVYCKQV